MAGEIYYNVSYKDRLINCPYCGFKITVMWTTLACCLKATCSHCDNIYMKVFNPVECLGCKDDCNYARVLMARSTGSI